MELRIPPTHPRQAFSLIELLIVIATIAILVGVLFPAIRTVRERAQRTQCTASLRQWHLSLAAWSTDHHGLVPSTNSAGGNFAPSHIWIRPSAAHPDNDLNLKDLSEYMDAPVAISGGTLSTATTIAYPPSWRCPTWRPPQTTVYHTVDYWYTTPGYQYYGQFTDPSWSAANQAAYVHDRLVADRLLMSDWGYFWYGPNLTRMSHPNGQNQLFGDGRIAWRAYNQTESAAVAAGTTGCPSVFLVDCRFYR